MQTYANYFEYIRDSARILETVSQYNYWGRDYYRDVTGEGASKYSQHFFIIYNEIATYFDACVVKVASALPNILSAICLEDLASFIVFTG